MSTTIYILKLRDGKYYVGKSDNVQKRFEQHLEGKGSAWTKKYSPINIEKKIPNASPFEEDRYVKEYMSKYGVDNVYFVDRPRKHRYVFFVGNKSDKKQMRNDLTYEVMPYPKGDTKRYDSGGIVSTQELLFT